MLGSGRASGSAVAGRSGIPRQYKSDVAARPAGARRAAEERTFLRLSPQERFPVFFADKSGNLARTPAKPFWAIRDRHLLPAILFPRRVLAPPTARIPRVHKRIFDEL
jgi:hypothetical protein